MSQIRRCFLGLLLTTSLVGCAFVSAVDLAVLALSVPVPVQKRTAELSGYSLGPAPSEEATELLLAAIPPEEGVVHFTGRVEWTGLSRLKQSVGELYQSLGAVSDFNILFLWWSEDNERYEVLIRLPFTDIHSIELLTPGFGTAVGLCLEMDEIPVTDEVLVIDRKSTLRVMKPGVFMDAEKTEELFKVLDSKIIRSMESQDRPHRCDEVPVSGEESSIGFGNCDPAVEEC